MKTKRLGDAELEIMMVLWDESKPVTAGYILSRIKETRSWALSTLMATLARLAEKGFVYCDRTTRTNLYSALISAEEYRASEGKSLFQRLYNGSAKKMIASLYSSNAISKEDLAELRDYIDQLEKGD